MQELPMLDAVEGVDRCRCDGGQPKNFARPCLLLLLAESSAHGYELIDRLMASRAAKCGARSPRSRVRAPAAKIR